MRSILLATLLCFPPKLCGGAEQAPQAPPPKWTADVLDAFFADAREQLVGERPKSSIAKNEKEETESPTPATTESGASPKWSVLIDEETLFGEVRRLNTQLSLQLRDAAKFQAGGYQECRRDLAMLSLLLDVIGKFDREIRWQQVAPQLSNQMNSASEACQSGTAESLATVEKAQLQLADLLRGQAPDESSETTAGELQLVERPLLMQAMETALESRVAPPLANLRDFRRNYQQVASQAQVLGLLAEVIQREGYDYADDETYLDEARQFRSAAQELSAAAAEKNYESARAALGKVTQACSRCHEGYRG